MSVSGAAWLATIGAAAEVVSALHRRAEAEETAIRLEALAAVGRAVRDGVPAHVVLADLADGLQRARDRRLRLEIAMRELVVAEAAERDGLAATVDEEVAA